MNQELEQSLQGQLGKWEMSGSSNFSLGSFGVVSHTCLAAETTGLLATTPTQGLSTGPLLVACPRGQFVLPYRDGLRMRAQRDMTVQTSGGAVLWERHSGGAGDDNIGKAHLALGRRGLLAGTEAGTAKTQALETLGGAHPSLPGRPLRMSLGLLQVCRALRSV